MQVGKSAGEQVQHLTEWMKLKSAEAGSNGGVFGVSGGVDSAVIMALAREAWGDNCLGLILPCHSLKADVDDGLELVRMFSCPHHLIDLSPVYDKLAESLSVLGPGALLDQANLKPRLRMLALYYAAGVNRYLVLGSTNKAEYHLGYFTKFGDGGADMFPLIHLTKAQVKDIARYLGIPQRIVERTPSGGLWEGQTDEDEMGLTYAELDAYLTGGRISPEARENIETRHLRTRHKRTMPLVPDSF